uniref:RNase H type-1 domain-containing protein n=1 Tax=Cannabis sativa TaxID=3483 RepID=A0A803NPV3_CANSA
MFGEVFSWDCAIQTMFSTDPIRWMPPLPESFALTTDAQMVLGRGFVGLVGVIRDAAGAVWLVWSSSVLGDFSVNVAEPLAIRLGLTLAHQLDFIIFDY